MLGSVGRSIGNTPIFLDMMNKIMYSDYSINIHDILELVVFSQDLLEIIYI